MNIALHEQRCLFHPTREAVARCPVCSRFFCRECIAEHDDRVLCASCIAQLLRETRPRRSVFTYIGRVVGLAFGLACAWWFFALLGSFLMRAPASFHEGTIWENLVSR